MTKIYSDTNPTAQSTPSSLLLSSLSASLSHLSAVMLNEQQLDGAMASSFLFWCVFSQLCVCVCVVCVDELGAQQEVCVGTGKKKTHKCRSVDIRSDSRRTLVLQPVSVAMVTPNITTPHQRTRRRGVVVLMWLSSGFCRPQSRSESFLFFSKEVKDVFLSEELHF